MKNGNNFQMILSFFLFTIKSEFRWWCPPHMSLVFFQRNSFCAMSQILTKILLLNGMQNAQCVVNFHNSMSNGINFLMILSFFLFTVLIRVQMMFSLVFFDEILFAQWTRFLQKSYYSMYAKCAMCSELS